MFVKVKLCPYYTIENVGTPVKDELIFECADWYRTHNTYRFYDINETIVFEIREEAVFYVEEFGFLETHGKE